MNRPSRSQTVRMLVAPLKQHDLCGLPSMISSMNRKKTRNFNSKLFEDGKVKFLITD